MNPILEKKISELEGASDYECWYLVKQPTGFDVLCYLVSILKKYKSISSGKNLQDFIGDELLKLKETKPNFEIPNNYRALRVAAFFGLITMTSSKYDEATITETFEEITIRCNGDYEKTELYTDIIQRQIEKMFISSQIDEAYQGVRQEYRLYPVMLLYKVLIELGHSSGKYSISMTEYRYFVATTKRFEDFLETLLLIKLLREDAENTANELEKYKTKFDNRLILALKQLGTLTIDREFVALKPERIEEVANKVFIFEQNPGVFLTDNYLSFLGSVKSLFELENRENDDKISAGELTSPGTIDESSRLRGGINVLLYGVPGCGKSHTIKNRYCKDADGIERVVFHPDYTYGDFVGQIMPITGDDGKIRYEYSPGPFTRILSAAYNNPTKKYCLVVEEINRGNAPAIFGDIFQLLDREENGSGSYEITNVDVADKMYINNKASVSDPSKIMLPSNLYIFAAMNTSDQNVFTLDTAFQRRWNMRMVENDVTKALKIADKPILDTTIKWAEFNRIINELILSKNIGMASSEDKRLGAYFVTENDLYFYTTGDGITQEEADDRNHNFPEKVLKYLWDDAFKFTRDEVFQSAYDSLEKLIKAFENAKGNMRFNIFLNDIFELEQ